MDSVLGLMWRGLWPGHCCRAHDFAVMRRFVAWGAESRHLTLLHITSTFSQKGDLYSVAARWLSRRRDVEEQHGVTH